MKHTDYHDKILVKDTMLNDTEHYRIQTVKERFGAMTVGYDTSAATEVSYYGIVKDPISLRFNGTDGVEYTSDSFIITAGTGFTRFNENTNLSLNPYYDGNERIRLASSQVVSITHKSIGDVNNYVFAIAVELQKNKQFDRSGTTIHYIDREEAYIIMQLTQAQATSLGNYLSNPTGSVTLTDIAAPWLYSLFNNDDERSATFPNWTTPGGVFTISTYTITHYNSIFLGKVEVTNTTAPIKHKFYHTLQGGDPLLGIFSRPALSMIDSAHRNNKGNGTLSNKNPHAQSVTDLDTYNETIVDHRNLHHSNGIFPKYATSLKCTIDGIPTPDTLKVAPFDVGSYLFLDGKRITSFTSSIAFDTSSAGTYYICIQDSGNAPLISNSYPYEQYQGFISQATSIPANSFVLCSVYWDNGTQTLKAFNGDQRYIAGFTDNPVNDMRVFGSTGYDDLHVSIVEALGKENLVFNGNFEVAENSSLLGWSGGNNAQVLPSSGSRCLKLASGETATSRIFPFDTTSAYSFRMNVYNSGGSTTYNTKLRFCRGNNKVDDFVGYSSILTDTSASYSSWTTKENQFSTESAITWDGAFNTKSQIGWAYVEIANTAGSDLYIDDVTIKPKISGVDFGDNTIVTTTTPYVVTITDNYKILHIDASGGNKTVDLSGYTNLPKGFRLGVKKTDGGSNTVTLSGATIDGSSNYILKFSYDYVLIEKGVTNFFILSKDILTVDHTKTEDFFTDLYSKPNGWTETGTVVYEYPVPSIGAVKVYQSNLISPYNVVAPATINDPYVVMEARFRFEGTFNAESNTIGLIDAMGTNQVYFAVVLGGTPEYHTSVGGVTISGTPPMSIYYHLKIVLHTTGAELSVYTDNGSLTLAPVFVACNTSTSMGVLIESSPLGSTAELHVDYVHIYKTRIRPF